MATNAELSIAIKAKNQAEKELKAASKSLKNLGDEADHSSRRMGGLGDKLKKIGKVAAVALPAIGGAAAVGLFKIGKSFDEAFDAIEVGTGATGDNLEDLKDSFKDVFSSLPVSMGDASKAIADLNTRTGATGETLEDMTKVMLEMTRITGGNLDANIVSVTRAMGDWGIEAEDSTGFMDKLFIASQATGIGIDKLAAQMVQFGAPMRQLGFSVDEAAALFGKFEKEGVNAELVMGSMRIALGQMARDGEPAVETFGRVVEAIKNAGDASEANKLALELFGSRAGPDMAAAIREGRFAIDDLVEMMGDAEGSIMDTAESTRSAGESFKILKNQIVTALEPAATAVFDFAGKVTSWLVGHTDMFSEFAGNVRDVAVAIGEVAIAIGAAALDAFVAVWETIEDPVRRARDAVRDIVGYIAGAALQIWKDFSAFLTETLIPAFKDLATWLSGTLKTAWEWIINTAIPRTTELLVAMVDAFEDLTGIDLKKLSQQIADLSAATATGKGDVDPFVEAWRKFNDFIGPLKSELGDLANQTLTDVKQLVGDVATALGPLIDQLVILADNLSPLTSLLGDLAGAIADNADKLKYALLPVFGQAIVAFVLMKVTLYLLIDVLRILLVEAIANVTAGLVSLNLLIENVITPTVNFLKDAFAKVVEILGDIPGALTSAFSGVGAILAPAIAVVQSLFDLLDKTIGLLDKVPGNPFHNPFSGSGTSEEDWQKMFGAGSGGGNSGLRPTSGSNDGTVFGQYLGSGAAGVLTFDQFKSNLIGGGGGINIRIETIDADSFRDFLARGGMDAIKRELRLEIGSA